ncbi:hypothetical protein [Aureimonas sp. AU12]|uniref:hypothetical protein n=1 Tax=Aureimonas sp. AU12 TaxID=1638161 RepID=UPI00078380D5|nr:hypothetical protein [Aureimonas sp. AU12]
MTPLSNDVEVELGGDTHLLRPSLKAATAISRQFGGLVGAMQAALNGNLDAFQFVVKTGIVTAKNISTEDLKELVWSAGMRKLSDPVSKYLTLLQNGGKDPDADEEDASTGNGGEG